MYVCMYVCMYVSTLFTLSYTHIHILSRPGRYLGGNLARTRKFLASERKFFGQQLTVAASKSSSTTLGIKSKVFLKMKIL